MSKNLIQIIGGIVIYIWNHISCSCENGKYLASIMDDSAIMSDEIIESYDEEIKTVPTNFNEKILLVEHKISIFYLHFCLSKIMSN